MSLIEQGGTWRVVAPRWRRWQAARTKAWKITPAADRHVSVVANPSVPAPPTDPTKAVVSGGMPVAGAVGVPAGRVLTVLTSANRPYAADTFSGAKFVVNTANAVFDGYQFNDLVEVRAPGVVFRNCSFRGADPNPPNSGLLLVSFVQPGFHR